MSDWLALTLYCGYASALTAWALLFGSKMDRQLAVLEEINESIKAQSAKAIDNPNATR